MMKQEEIIAKLIDAGVLVTPDMLTALEKGEISKELQQELPAHIIKLLEKNSQESTQESTQQTNNEKTTLNEKSAVFGPKIQVLSSYNKKSKKRTYDDFVQYFRHRYTAISNILRGRQELMGVTSISRMLGNKDSNEAAIIGMISDKKITKNNNIILTLEDTTGECTVIVHQNKPELIEIAKDLVLDEIIGITGNVLDKAIFANKIIFPDIPLGRELKKNPTEEYMVIIGDPHVGSKEFLSHEFKTFIAWLQGKVGNESQKAIAKKVKYAIFVGDLVEGVGIYPGQEEDLLIKDIKEQYKEFTKLFKTFPEHIQVAICPGNHDAGRIAEPQPPIYKEFAPDLYEMPQVTMISSPGMINIGATKNFPGFDLLIYHGYSLIYYSDNVPSIRNAGGQKATDRIMKFLLQRRHLAPTHGSNLYIPDAEEDPLVIQHIPDFFLTGHIHRTALASYRNITMINASTWTDITEDQEKRGLEPQPARVPLVNLQTREVKIMNFYRGKKIVIKDPIGESS